MLCFPLIPSVVLISHSRHIDHIDIAILTTIQHQHDHKHHHHHTITIPIPIHVPVELVELDAALVELVPVLAVLGTALDTVLALPDMELDTALAVLDTALDNVLVVSDIELDAVLVDPAAAFLVLVAERDAVVLEPVVELAADLVEIGGAAVAVLVVLLDIVLAVV